MVHLIFPIISWVVTGSNYFMIDTYNSWDPCYSEFEKGDKREWAACCDEQLDSTKDISDNCQGKYYPNDVCYPAIQAGWTGVNAGQIGIYENEAWALCCETQCRGLCYSSYCNGWVKAMEEWVDSWLDVFFWCFVGLSATMILCLAACCFWCFRDYKRKSDASRLQMLETAKLQAMEQSRLNQQGAHQHVVVKHELDERYYQPYEPKVQQMPPQMNQMSEMQVQEPQTTTVSADVI